MYICVCVCVCVYMCYVCECMCICVCICIFVWGSASVKEAILPLDNQVCKWLTNNGMGYL